MAIVGRELPQYADGGLGVCAGPNTGSMGQVENILPKLTIKRRYAMEVDYLFVTNPQKRNLKKCAEFVASGSEDYGLTLLMNRDIVPIRPITYHIQKILAAASVLAHPKLVTPEQLEQAKATIMEKKCINKEMVDVVWDFPEEVGVSIGEIHIPDFAAEDVWTEIEKELGGHNSWFAGEGILDYMSGIVDDFIALDTVKNYVNRYSHLGAISIMVRGGFKNLLEAYLSAQPPIEAFMTTARDLLKDIGYPEAYALLEVYNG